MTLDALAEQIQHLQQHSTPQSPEPRNQGDGETCLKQRLLMSAGLSSDAPVFVPAQLKAEIVANRISATTTSRTVEREIAEVMALSLIPEAAMRVILERLCRLFETVARIRSAWLPEDVRITEIRQLCARGNHRQHFHILRDLLPPLRSLLERLVAAHNTSDPLLLQLNQSGVLNGLHVIDVVANAHEHLTEEILSPPTELRRLWKPVAVERRAPGDSDGTMPGPYTQHLWSSGLRVRNARNPPVSEVEIRSLFGPSASMATHGSCMLPYACGAHKYRLVEDNPIVLECTSKGLFMTSGPSGTAYRFLNLWLALNGPEEELPAVQFATASLLLSGSHHSLVEVLMTCAPLLRRDMPSSLLGMIDQQVPSRVKITTSCGEVLSITPEEFYEKLPLRIDNLLGKTPRLNLKAHSAPADLVDSSEWPSPTPPTAGNISLAIDMCRTIDSSTEPTFCSTRQTGWSTQDCIKINVAAQGYMVKVPKQHTAESISTCLAEGVRASWAAERGIGPRVVALDEQSGAFATEFIRGRTLSPADVTGSNRRHHGASAETA